MNTIFDECNIPINIENGFTSPVVSGAKAVYRVTFFQIDPAKWIELLDRGLQSRGNAYVSATHFKELFDSLSYGLDGIINVTYFPSK